MSEHGGRIREASSALPPHHSGATVAVLCAARMHSTRTTRYSTCFATTSTEVESIVEF